MFSPSPSPAPAPYFVNGHHYLHLPERIQESAASEGQSISEGRSSFSTLRSVKGNILPRPSQISVNINPDEIEEVGDRIIPERSVIKTPRKFKCDQKEAYLIWKNNKSDALELAASQTFLRARHQVADHVIDFLEDDMGEQMEGSLKDYLNFNFEDNLPSESKGIGKDECLDKFSRKLTQRNPHENTPPWCKESDLTDLELEERNNFFYVKNSLVVLEK
ncbi:hypothetical protein K3495_g7385 [Podosphaera aphanis]|nr:hypothetical protein K3495_g7385 [Podosphaera aphanis]